MDILAFILACSLFSDDVTAQSIINVQSSACVYYVGDSTGLVPASYADNIADAINQIHVVRRHKGKPLIGLMGIPSHLARKYGYNPEDLFNPCKNIAVGSSILSEIETDCTDIKNKTACVIRRYGVLLGYKGDVFLRSVMNVSRLVKDTSDNDYMRAPLTPDSDSNSADESPYYKNESIFLEDRINRNTVINNAD